MNDHIHMRNEDMVEKIRQKFERRTEVLDERSRRVWAAVEAEALGHGGQSIVAKATGLSRTTLHREGLEKGREPQASQRGRIRNVGGSQGNRNPGTAGVVGTGSTG